MAAILSLLHKRGVDANRPSLSDGELYIATDSKRVFHGSVPNRLSVCVADVDLTAQSAAKTATTLFTPSVSAFYEIEIYLKVTTAATTSSTLGAVTIAFTDGTDSVAQSLTALLATQAGVAATTNTGNSTTTVLQGSVKIWAKTGVAVTYAIAYVSSGATAMQYEAHLRARTV